MELLPPQDDRPATTISKTAKRKLMIAVFISTADGG
jgi:hypothetical protein